MYFYSIAIFADNTLKWSTPFTFCSLKNKFSEKIGRQITLLTHWDEAWAANVMHILRGQIPRFLDEMFVDVLDVLMRCFLIYDIQYNYDNMNYLNRKSNKQGDNIT